MFFLMESKFKNMDIKREQMENTIYCFLSSFAINAPKTAIHSISLQILSMSDILFLLKFILKDKPINNDPSWLETVGRNLSWMNSGHG